MARGGVVLEDKITGGEVKQEFTKQEKVVALFKFIEELNKLKQKVVLKVSDYPWCRSISSLPDDPENISVYYRDRVEEEDAENITDVLLSVNRYSFQSKGLYSVTAFRYASGSPFRIRSA